MYELWARNIETKKYEFIRIVYEEELYSAFDLPDNYYEAIIIKGEYTIKYKEKPKTLTKHL